MSDCFHAHTNGPNEDGGGGGEGMNLTLDDLNVLGDALESWEHKDDMGDLLGGLVGGLVFGNDAEGRAEFEAKEAERRREQQEAARLRKERSILLRAKLIQMADEIRAEMLARSRNG